MSSSGRNATSASPTWRFPLVDGSWQRTVSFAVTVLFAGVLIFQHAVLMGDLPGTLAGRHNMEVQEIFLGLTGMTVMWWPWVGLAFASLGIALAYPLDVTPDGAIIVVAILGIVPLRSRGAILGTIVLTTAYAIVQTVLSHHQAPLVDLLIVVVLFGAIYALAFVLRTLITRTRAQVARIVELERTVAEVQREERNQLARELHDLVAHQLSIATLQIMGHRDSPDIEELRTTLDRVDEANRSALNELRVLVGVLRDEEALSVASDRLTTLLGEVIPSRAASDVTNLLTSSGFEVTRSVDADADALDLSVQRTISRVLREASTNILRHARPGGPVHLEVTVNDRDARVSVRNALAPDAGPLAGAGGGFGLIGLRERVELTGGTFAAGRRGEEWIVEAVLPYDELSPGVAGSV